MWLHAGLKSEPALEERFGLSELYRGGFIGSIELTAVIPMTEQRWRQWRDKHLDPGEYKDGLVAWMITDPRRFRSPVPGKGQLNLFYPTPDVVQLLYANVETAEEGEYGAAS